MFNEAEIVGEMHRRLAAVMATLARPGRRSTSTTAAATPRSRIVEVLRQADSHIALVNLSRNFGKEIATTAGSTMRAAMR